MALVRPSSPFSMVNSTGSPSAKLRKPSVIMFVCRKDRHHNQARGSSQIICAASSKTARPLPQSSCKRQISKEREERSWSAHLVDKQVLASTVWGNKAISFGAVEPKEQRGESY